MCEYRGAKNPRCVMKVKVVIWAIEVGILDSSCRVCTIDRSGYSSVLKDLSESTSVGTRKRLNYARIG